jgi:predicted RNase H-like HicB family nuclease
MEQLRTTMRDYHINIFYSEEDQGYIADIPDLVACSAFGKSPDKALAALLRARRAWVAAAKVTDVCIPPPRYVVGQVKERVAWRHG